MPLARGFFMFYSVRMDKDTPGTRRCNKCKATKPEDDFFRVRRPDRPKQTHRARCKSCVAADRRATDRVNGAQKCQKCRERKPVTEFRLLPSGRRAQSCPPCLAVSNTGTRMCRTCKARRPSDQFKRHRDGTRGQKCDPCRIEAESPEGRERAREARRARGIRQHREAMEKSRERDAHLLEDVRFLHRHGESMDAIATRVGVPLNILKARLVRVDPDAAKLWRDGITLTRTECEEISKRATAWLLKRYAERGYSTGYIANLHGHDSSGIIRKAAERNGFVVTVDWRVASPESLVDVA